MTSKSTDNAADHGEFRTDLKWVKSEIQDQRQEIEKTHDSIIQTRAQLSSELKAVATSLGKSLEDLTEEFRQDILARATAKTVKAEAEGKKDEAIENRFGLLEKKHAVLAVLIAVIIGMLGAKFSGVPWLI